MKAKIFKFVVLVNGNLISRFVFENEKNMAEWLNVEFPKLQDNYDTESKKLSYTVRVLDGMEIGDECHVSGDGDEVYVIVDQIKYSPNRYGFILDSGFSEEVYKCGRVVDYENNNG